MFNLLKFSRIEKELDNYGYSRGIKLDLERIEKLLQLLGDPHLKIPVIHIAGTNGKGSTSLLVSNALIASDYRVGTYLSPHLISYRERYLIDGIQISKKDFISIYERVMEQAEKVKEVTAFEIMTAMAFLYFDQNQIDVAVMETGMGGRYDATNVCRSILTIITPISLDHQLFLGEDLASIGREKAGIIKKDVPLVSSSQPNEAMKQIVAEIEKNDNEFSVVNYPLKYKLPFKGANYRYNAALAMEAILRLRKRGIYIHRHTVLNGFARTILPARYQLISKDPKIILDSAHNAAGFKNLIENLNQDYLVYKKIWIIGLKIDKDLSRIARQLRGHSELIITTDLDSKQSYSSGQLQEYFISEGFHNVLAVKNGPKALKMAKKQLDEQTIIVIAGSFLLGGEIMKSERIPVRFIQDN